MTSSSSSQTSDITKGIVLSIDAQELKIWVLMKAFEQKFRLWPMGGYKLRGYSLDIGDLIQIDEKGKNITKSEEETVDTKVFTSDGARDRIEVTIGFVPLFYSLYPATAKERNLVLSYSNELGYVPITKKNTYKNHCLYIGNAIYFLNKRPDENKIAEVYSTGWFLYNHGVPASIEQVQERFEFVDGVIMDSSLADVFMVYNEQLGLLSLRKDNCTGLDIGDWIKFAHIVVDEAEKSDESKVIFPCQQDEMTFFTERRIALHPIKMDSPPYATKALGEKQIEITYQLKVPINPTHKGVYKVPFLGNVIDKNGLIGVKNEDSTTTISIHSRIINYQTVEFVVADMLDSKEAVDSFSMIEEMLPTVQQTSAQERPAMTFLGEIERQRHAAAAPRRPLATMCVNGDRGKGEQQEQPAPSATNPMQRNSPPEKIKRPANESLEYCQQTPPPSADTNSVKNGPEKIKRPPNSVSVNGIIIEAVTNANNDNHVLAFSNDFSINSKIIRLDSNHIEPLPKLGQWVEIILKKNERTRGRSAFDFTVWRAEQRSSNLYETAVGANDRIKIRVPLRMSDNGSLYNKDLGIVNNIERRLNIPENNGERQRIVMAWCAKSGKEEARAFGFHWEIAQHPEPEWQDTRSPEVRKNVTTNNIPLKIGYIGSRYRKREEEDSSSQEKQSLKLQMRTINPASLIVPSTSFVNEQESMNIRPNNNTTMSERKTPSPDPIEDLIDLHSEIRPQQTVQDDYLYFGVIASHDAKSGGYYVYTNKLPSEVFLPPRRFYYQQNSRQLHP